MHSLAHNKVLWTRPLIWVNRFHYFAHACRKAKARRHEDIKTKTRRYEFIIIIFPLFFIVVSRFCLRTFVISWFCFFLDFVFLRFRYSVFSRFHKRTLAFSSSCFRIFFIVCLCFRVSDNNIYSRLLLTAFRRTEHVVQLCLIGMTFSEF